MSIDHYVKFISEQALNNGMSTPQLNEEWKVKEVHNDGNPYEGEGSGGGQEEGNRVRGTLVHKDGHEYKFDVTGHGHNDRPDLHVNEKSLPRTNTNLGVTPYHAAERTRSSAVENLGKTAHETAMKVWKSHQEPGHSSKR